MTAALDSIERKLEHFPLLKSFAKFVVPTSARQRIRTLHRAVSFHRAMKKFLANVEQELPFNRDVIDGLIFGWGDEAWSAESIYLISCLEHARQCRGPILECGSGLSTLLIGAVVQKTGNLLCSLEHQKIWGDRLVKQLKRYGITSVHLHVRPLKDYADFAWYQAPEIVTTNKYALVVCDGPPSATRGGRYGLIPMMKTRLAPGCIILLDDAGRTHEQLLANRWAIELCSRYETVNAANPYIRFELARKAA